MIVEMPPQGDSIESSRSSMGNDKRPSTNVQGMRKLERWVRKSCNGRKFSHEERREIVELADCDGLALERFMILDAMEAEDEKNASR